MNQARRVTTCSSSRHFKAAVSSYVPSLIVISGLTPPRINELCRDRCIAAANRFDESQLVDKIGRSRLKCLKRSFLGC
jgi:hypothetical protein